MRAAEYLVETGIHPGLRRNGTPARDWLKSEPRRGPTSNLQQPQTAFRQKLTLALTKKFSLRSFEYQYRGVSITDCLRCDIKAIELGY
jgi:hypothetical protein